MKKRTSPKQKMTAFKKHITPVKTDTIATIEVKRHMGALAEQFSGQVSAVAEQMVGIYGKFDEVNERFDGIDEKLSVHTEMIGTMMQDIEIIKSDVDILKSGMRKTVDFKDFEALERRMRLVETKLRR